METFTTLQQVRDAVNNGDTVTWRNSSYTVQHWADGSYNVVHSAGNAVGMTDDYTPQDFNNESK